MRTQPVLIFALFTLNCSSAENYPLWNTTESPSDYARHVNLPPTLTLDCAGENLELVLIPPGKFLMGTPPASVPPRTEQAGKRIAMAGGATLLLFLYFALRRARKKDRRLQFSLLACVAVTFLLGMIVGGIVDSQKMRAAWKRHHSALFYDNDDVFLQREITLTHPFYMARFETTQAQFQALLSQNPVKFHIGPNVPVCNLEFDLAETFCRTLSLRCNRKVRLPTEAEWEYACRAGTISRFNTGDTEADLIRGAWTNLEPGAYGAHPVGKKAPNAFGLYDMHGNVWERCSDWYARYQPGPVTDPQGPVSGEEHVVRGGSWSTFDANHYSASYRGTSVGNRVERTGLRIVVNVK